MRPIAGFLLLIILALPFFGITSWFAGRLAWVRQDADVVLAADATEQTLVRLTFALADVDDLLEWEHAREFEYRGEMYDVARTEKAADSITYWCHHDMKESSLRREIGQWLARTYGRPDPGAPAPVQQLGRFFAALFPPAVAQWDPICIDQAATRTMQDPWIGETLFDTPPPSPPPWFA